jgi:hypothetical protein
MRWMTSTRRPSGHTSLTDISGRLDVSRLSFRASSIDADAWATRLVPPGDAEEERLKQLRTPPLDTRFKSLAVLQAASCSDLLSAESRAWGDRGN